MTVGELRKRLEGLADTMPVFLEISTKDEDLAQATLHSADVESRCLEDDEEGLFLWGDEELRE